jgi:hypothetical protein
MRVAQQMLILIISKDKRYLIMKKVNQLLMVQLLARNLAQAAVEAKPIHQPKKRKKL